VSFIQRQAAATASDLSKDSRFFRDILLEISDSTRGDVHLDSQVLQLLSTGVFLQDTNTAISMELVASTRNLSIWGSYVSPLSHTILSPSKSEDRRDV
jgi:hypothetical protein